MRVLVVDDNRDAADSLAWILAADGHDVRTEYNPLRVLAIALSFFPEFVFLDIQMPRLSGYDVVTQLRRHTRFSRIPIAALTGNGSPVDKAMSSKHGFDYHFVKPADVEQIRQVVRTANEMSVLR